MRRSMHLGITAATGLALGLASSGCNKTKLDALPSSHSETHYQTGAPPPVDVVFVIDNSGSMSEEQTKLGQNFASFIQHFTALGLDYHLAVITTDVESADESGRFQGAPLIITKDTPDVNNVFLQSAAVGTQGSGAETGLGAIQLAFSEPALTYNAGFLRPDAILAVVIVSDEEDFSDGDNSEPPMSLAPPVSDTVNFLLGLKAGDPAKVIMPVIVGDVPGGCTADAGVQAEAGVRYHEAATALNGSKSSICSQDFATVLDAIGAELTGLVTAFPLEYAPDVDSITVLVNGVAVPYSETSGWYWDTELGGVAFAATATPDACAKIEISYAVDDFGGPIEEGNAEAPPEECPVAPIPVGDGALEGGYFACTVSGLAGNGAAAMLALAGLASAAVLRRRRRRR